MDANQLLPLITEHARPTWGPRVDEICQTATANHWTPQNLAAQVNRTIGPNTGTGYVIVTLEKLANKPQQTHTPTNITGPCQQGCDHGWTNSNTTPHATVPCPSCRPATHHRIAVREAARANGAGLDELARITLDTPREPIPHTHWTTTHA